MPQKSTRRPGPITSGIDAPWAAASCAGLGRSDDVAARFFVRLKLDQAFLLRFLEKIGEGAEAVVSLVEPRIPALERLLDHRAPDFFVRAALGDQRFQGAKHHVERFLLLIAVPLVGDGARRRGVL